MELRTHLLSRGGIVDRIEKLEAESEQQSRLLWKGLGIIGGVAAVGAAVGSKLSAVLGKIF